MPRTFKKIMEEDYRHHGFDLQDLENSLFGALTWFKENEPGAWRVIEAIEFVIDSIPDGEVEN